MRKELLCIVATFVLAFTVQAQTKGTKLGFIDMEYILQNVPAYTEAQNQLEQKAQKWKQEIEAKKNEINKLKDALKAEKALLTKGLIEERTNEIVFLENENLEYQQKRFGPSGDLITQKNALTKPIQDQVFNLVQDIAESKKYDFIFDKTSDLTMLFAAKRFDISEQIVRALNRTEKRQQLTKKQLKEEEAKEAKQEAITDNPNLSERQKALEIKKLARDADIAAKLLAQEERKKAAEERKLQMIADKEAKRNGSSTSSASTPDKEAAIAAAAEAKQQQAEQRAEALKLRQQAIEDKKIAAEERRQQILDERAAKKSATLPQTTEADSTSNQETKSAAADEIKQKRAEAIAKTLEERKKAQEEKRKQVLDAKKTGTVSGLIEKDDKKTETIVSTEETADAPKATEDVKQKQAQARAKIIEERNKAIEERKKALEEKKNKILEEREANKKAKEDQLKTVKDNTNNN